MSKSPLSKMSGAQKTQFWEQKALAEGYGKDPAVTAKYDQMASIGAGQGKSKNGACPPYEALRHALADIKSKQSVDASASADSSACATSSANGCQPFSGQSDFSLTAKLGLELEGKLGASGNECGCRCESPKESDACHPEGGLKADDKTVTTPGGYKIQSNDKHELTITGPDGKSSKIWGDPHVQGSDGNKFDFKNPSSFVLDDGTRIDVSTSEPDKNGVTYATGAQITNGNDRVQISDLDKGPGKIGQVSQDGLQHAHDFDGKDVFKEAGDASHWAKDGKEVVQGDKNGDYKLGKDVDTSKVDQKLNGLEQALAKGDAGKAGDENPFAQKPYGDAQGLGVAMGSVREMMALFSALSQLFE